MKKRSARTTLTTLAGVLALLAVPGTARAADGGQGPDRGRQGVSEVLYNLGDEAFRPPKSLGYVGNNELDGAVYVPADLAEGRHPLIVIEHGIHATCADADAARDLAAAKAALARDEETGDTADAEKQQAVIDATVAALYAWPCAPGTDQIPSYRGYDYLGRDLARRGFVVVSIGTNGINSTSFGQADTVYQARAKLIERHLVMWRQLSQSGGGPLKGAFTDAASGRATTVDFRGHVDLGNVGLIGHSMGGAAVMQEIDDPNRTSWPRGVTIRAAFALAPAATWDEVTVTRTPFAVMWGTCDTTNGGTYVEQNAARNKVPITKFTLTGGVHNFYNTQWSPAGGQVLSEDESFPGSRPGTCMAQFPDADYPQQDQDELSERQQRLLTRDYVGAFFAHHLLGDRRYDAVLRGEERFPGAPDVVDVRYDAGK
ncbi:alpha/beta hydrolase [Streptomyces sp. NPDC046977]|uniref:alpha/beta hydrolase n=1 Tax=Streptomyces sp. NPDC046977 TaxID=3154703 RepID=UPI0033C0004C